MIAFADGFQVKFIILDKLTIHFIKVNVAPFVGVLHKLLRVFQTGFVTLDGCRGHVYAGEFTAFLIVFTE